MPPARLRDSETYSSCSVEAEQLRRFLPLDVYEDDTTHDTTRYTVPRLKQSTYGLNVSA